MLVNLHARLENHGLTDILWDFVDNNRTCRRAQNLGVLFCNFWLNCVFSEDTVNYDWLLDRECFVKHNMDIPESCKIM